MTTNGRTSDGSSLNANVRRSCLAAFTLFTLKMLPLSWTWSGVKVDSPSVIYVILLFIANTPKVGTRTVEPFKSFPGWFTKIEKSRDLGSGKLLFKLPHGRALSTDSKKQIGNYQQNSKSAVHSDHMTSFSPLKRGGRKRSEYLTDLIVQSREKKIF